MTTHPAVSPAGTVPGADRHWLAQAAEGAFRLEGESTRPSGFAACALGGDLASVADARLFIRSTLSGWGMDAVVDSAAVVVSELLSNALRYGLADVRQPVPAGHPIWLGLLRRGPTVLCAVSDPSSAEPVLKEPDYLTESGRGLHIVDALSDSWGWTEPDRDGKAVWAVLCDRERSAADHVAW